MITRVYKYGLLPPRRGTDSEAMFDEIAGKQFRYRNKMIGATKEQSDQLKDWENENEPRIAPLVEKFKEARGAKRDADDALKKWKHQNRNKKVRNLELEAKKRSTTELYTRIKQELSDLRKPLRENESYMARREEIFAASKARLQAGGDVHTEFRKELPWLLREPEDKAYGKSKKDRYLSWDKHHATLIARRGLERCVEWDEPNHKGHTVLRMPVGSIRSHKFIEFPMIMHRPLPPGAKITQVSVVRHQHCRRSVFAVLFQLEMPSPETRTGNRALAFDIGWRLMPDQSVRVGALRGDDGYAEIISVPAAVLEGFGFADKIDSNRDTMFNKVRDDLVHWLSKDGADKWPDWLLTRYQTRHMERAKGKPYRTWLLQWMQCWRSKQRLLHLVQYWARHRTDGDELLMGSQPEPKAKGVGGSGLLRWAYRERHLDDYADGRRARKANSRNDRFAKLAASLADRYDVLVLEANTCEKEPGWKLIDISSADLKGRKGDDGEHGRGIRRRMGRAAPGTFRSMLVNAFLNRGGRVVGVEAAYTTKICHLCGSVEKVSFRKVMHTCSSCKVKWDQDDNACWNMLGLHKDGKHLGVKRNEPTEKFWAKIRAKKAEKQFAQNEAGKTAEAS